MPETLQQLVEQIEGLVLTAEIKTRLTELHVAQLKAGVELMSAELDRLTEEVRQTNAVSASAVALIKGLADQLRATKDDPAKIAALADELDAKTNELSAAVAENTPAAPTP